MRDEMRGAEDGENHTHGSWGGGASGESVCRGEGY